MPPILLLDIFDLYYRVICCNIHEINIVQFSDLVTFILIKLKHLFEPCVK
jgi:hypothetical protein